MEEHPNSSPSLCLPISPFLSPSLFITVFFLYISIDEGMKNLNRKKSGTGTSELKVGRQNIFVRSFFTFSNTKLMVKFTEHNKSVAITQKLRLFTIIHNHNTLISQGQCLKETFFFYSFLAFFR